jgi:hypothetical protein
VIHVAINVAACAVMLVFAAVVAIEMPHRGMWGRRLTLWALSFSLAAEATLPWTGILPAPTWPAALLHALLALVMLAWRQELLALLRSKLHAADPPSPRRRKTDFGELDEARRG